MHLFSAVIAGSLSSPGPGTASSSMIHWTCLGGREEGEGGGGGRRGREEGEGEGGGGRGREEGEGEGEGGGGREDG